MHVIGLVIGILFAGFIIIMRLKKSKRPILLKNIILPPFFMSTGFMMFVYPPFRPDPTHVLLAFVIGMVFSIPLIWSTEFEYRANEIFLKPSRAFIITLIGLFLVRTIIRVYASQSITELQSSGMFFIMAFGMVLPWRIGMYFKYKNLTRLAPLQGE